MKEGKIDYAPIIQKRVREIAFAKGMDLEDLIEACPLKEDTIRNIWYGRSHDPNLSTMAALSETLNTSINCLIGKCQHTPQERAVLNNFRKCGTHGRSIIDMISRYEASAILEERERKENRLIPCIIPHGDIRAGIIYELCDTNQIETNIPDADVALQITNNDLAPQYCKDDILFFQNRFPKHSEKAAFYIGEKIFIREFIEENRTYILKSLHKQGKDIVVKRMDEVDYMGTLIGVKRG